MSRQQATCSPQLQNVLLVEDQAIIALSTAARLSRDGYAVTTARSGEHALDLVEKSIEGGSRFGLVLMDIDLGAGIDGVEAAQRILEHHELPIVFLTGHAEPEYVDRVRELTRYGYVLKSSGDLMLRLTMETAVDLFAANRLTREQHRELEAIYDHAPVMMLVVDGNANVMKANRRARERAALTDEEAASTTLGRVVECIRAATNPDACGHYPECDRCGLRALVTETLESGAEFDDIPVSIETGAPDAARSLRLSVSCAPLDRGDGRCALVSVIDLDAFVGTEENGRS